jgi:hypothetical protein
MARWRDYLFYSGSDGSSPNHEQSIGVLELSNTASGWRYPDNPIIPRADVGMGGSGQGIAVFDVLELGDTLYLFGAQFNGGFDLFAMEASPDDPYTWSNYTIIFSSHYRNHCPFVMRDPTDSSQLLMFYSWYEDGNPPYVVGLLTASTSDPYTWTEDTATVLSISGTYCVYPDVRYNASEGVYRMLLSTNDSSVGSFRTVELATTDPRSWPTNRNTIIEPTGQAGDFDEDYAAVSRKIGGHVYYSGRPAGSNYYQGIGVKSPSNLGDINA